MFSFPGFAFPTFISVRRAPGSLLKCHDIVLTWTVLVVCPLARSSADEDPVLIDSKEEEGSSAQTVGGALGIKRSEAMFGNWRLDVKVAPVEDQVHRLYDMIDANFGDTRERPRMLQEAVEYFPKLFTATELDFKSAEAKNEALLWTKYVLCIVF